MDDSLSFNVNLNNFNGPLEVLLDLAKSQKVDLEKISITILVDQFLDFIKSNEKINLEFLLKVIPPDVLSIFSSIIFPSSIFLI